jgi:hypothetical protein
MVKISLLSVNLASMSKKPDNIEFPTKSEKPDSNVKITTVDYKKKYDETPNLHVEMTQEDGRISTYGKAYDNESIVKNVSNSALIWRSVGKESLNQMTTKQNAVIRVWEKRDRNHPAEILARGRIQLSSKGKNTLKNKFLTGMQKGLGATGLGLGLGITKGAVYLKIKYQNSIFLFINMHLQMNKKEPGLGFETRKKGFFGLLKELQSLKLIDDATSVFIGGDLNFRMDMEGKNQLNSIMPEMPFLKELPIDNKKFTCKFKEGDSTPCRTESIPDTLNVGLYKAGINRRHKGCMDPLRIPSRCDRFLYRLPSNKTIEIPYYEVLNLIPESDHNAIWAVVNVINGDGTTFSPWNPTPFAPASATASATTPAPALAPAPTTAPGKQTMSFSMPSISRCVTQKIKGMLHKISDTSYRINFENELPPSVKASRQRTRKN